MAAGHRVEELMALTGDYNVVLAAYQEAIKRTRVLADSRGQT